MRIEIVTIGNEVLSGRTFDTNFVHLARALEEASVVVAYHSTVGDTVDAIGDALKLALTRADA
jgi:nicotinamide-nucleotide amidase